MVFDICRLQMFCRCFLVLGLVRRSCLLGLPAEYSTVMKMTWRCEVISVSLLLVTVSPISRGIHYSSQISGSLFVFLLVPHISTLHQIRAGFAKPQSAVRVYHEAGRDQLYTLGKAAESNVLLEARKSTRL